MTGASVQKRKGYLVLGGIGAFVAAGYLGMALQLPFGDMTQPGAAVFPVMCGALLLLGSVATIWEGWRMAPQEQVLMPVGADMKRLLSLVALLLVYFVALPWIGQLLASGLFCFALMRVLSPLPASRVAVYSAVISGTLYALFVYLLKVPMPRGDLFI